MQYMLGQARPNLCLGAGYKADARLLPVAHLSAGRLSCSSGRALCRSHLFFVLSICKCLGFCLAHQALGNELFRGSMSSRTAVAGLHVVSLVRADLAVGTRCWGTIPLSLCTFVVVKGGLDI